MKNIEYDIPIFESNDLADLDLYSEKMATAIKGQIDKITTNVDGKVTEIQDNIEEINKKDTEQDNKIVELQNEKIELEKELKEIQEDFYQSSIRGQASGEYIHVEDSSGARCKIGIGGNHKQEIYSGKNKYPLPNEQTINGIKVSHNKDGTFNLIGTATAETFIPVSTTNILNDKKVYTISKNTTNVGMAGYEYNINTWLQTFVIIGKSEKSKTFTYNKNSNMTRNILQINIANGTVLNETNIKIMLEENSNETEWEPYAGGIPAPNPDYPSEIKTVGSNINLFNAYSSDLSYYLRNTDKEKYTINNSNSIKVEGTGVSWNRVEITISNLKPNTKYTITSQITNTTQGYAGLLCDYGNNSVQYVSNKEKFNAKITIVTDENGKVKLQLFTNYTSTVQNSSAIFDDIKLVEGTEVGEYSKYGQGSVKVTKCNKNIAKDITYTEQVTKYSRIIYATYTLIKGKTYYFSFDTDNSGLQVYRQSPSALGLENANVYSFTCDGKRKSFYGVASKTKTITMEVINRLSDSSNTPVTCSNFMISTLEDISHEPHQEQSYIIPTQQEMLEGDYFDWDNEEEVHVWEKLVFKGNENWNLDDIYNGIAQFSLSVNAVYINEYDTVIRTMSNYFKGVGFDSSWLIDNCVTIRKNSRVRIMISKYTTVEQFKTWLKSKYDEGTPVIVYYKLATPKRLPFTEEQKEIEKELNNARTYKNVTNIYTTDEVSPAIELNYAKDLETLINNVQALALSNVSEGV